VCERRSCQSSSSLKGVEQHFTRCAMRNVQQVHILNQFHPSVMCQKAYCISCVSHSSAPVATSRALFCAENLGRRAGHFPWRNWTQ